MSTLTVIVLCDRKRGSATAWNQAEGKSFCILILHKEKSIAPSCRALLAPKHRQDQSQWESCFRAPWLFHALKDSVRHMQLVSSTASR
jgi:hypothetical protein